MQLDIEKTKIDVVEQMVYDTALSAMVNTMISVEFIATLDGESIEGHTIHMSRTARTPDGAIKALFEAMTAASVSL